MPGSPDLPRLGVLGPAVVDGEVVGGIEGSLLALLALRPNREMARSSLTGALWPDAEPDKARGRLKTYVWRLRRAGYLDALGAEIAADRTGYRLEIAPELVDHVEATRLLAEAEEAIAGGGWDSARRLLDRAVGLWRGRPLAELDNAPLWVPEVAELEEAHEHALEQRCAMLLQLGQTREALSSLQELVGAQPGRVRRWHLLVEGLRASGRTVDALAAVRQARRQLVELGQSADLVLLDDLEGSLLRNEEADPEGRVQVARRPSGPRDQLDLVGRDAELAALHRVWDLTGRAGAHLVVLDGPAGCGATSLAEAFLAQLPHAAVARLDPSAAPIDALPDGTVLVVDLDGGGSEACAEAARRLPPLTARVLALVLRTSPRGPCEVIDVLERAIGPATIVPVAPLNPPLLRELAARLTGRAAVADDVARHSAGLPGLAAALVTDDADARDALLHRWAGDLDAADRAALATLLDDGRVRPDVLAGRPGSLAVADLIDRAVSAGLLVPDRDGGPGRWMLATPLLGPHLTAPAPAPA